MANVHDDDRHSTACPFVAASINVEGSICLCWKAVNGPNQDNGSGSTPPPQSVVDEGCLNKPLTNYPSTPPRAKIGSGRQDNKLYQFLRLCYCLSIEESGKTGEGLERANPGQDGV